MNRKIVILFAAALLLRMVAVLAIGEYKYPNTWESGIVARSLVAGHGFAFDWREMLATPPEPDRASTWWPPVYPLFLAAFLLTDTEFPYLWASIFQAVLLACIPVLLLLMGRLLFDGRTGWIAAVFSALYPPFLGFAALIQTAAFEIFWLTPAIFFAVKVVVPDPRGTAVFAMPSSPGSPPSWHRSLGDRRS